ncbi:MAG TPA: sigma-70 family RNA polymerase sigma factor [Acidobacteriaceae bacterium]|jgi:RNA polymerase sigma-70 factor (ECF subfamily)|nr:sigma-70 family RNA polymerase sigma factor [Acidobacteriaceae bacterium]
MRTELGEAIRLLRTGEAPDVQRALELLRRTVLSFGMKVCGQQEDAEDTAQEVLVRALPYLARLDDPQALSAWLYTAAKNRCWQGRRRATYRKAIALEGLIPDDTELHALQLTDPAANPESAALSRQDHQMLHQAVLALPPQYRIVLVLHDMEEMETEMVAKILSLQAGTVRVRLHRARLLVRKEMGKLLQRPSGPQRRKRSRVRRPAECREIFANLSEYLDGKMEAESCERMRSHIEACAPCVAFIADLKRAIDRCRALDVRLKGEAQPVLRRLLTREYLRLKNSSQNL